MIAPISMAGSRLGTLFVYRCKDPFSIDDIILTEYSTTVIGLAMQRAESEELSEETHKTMKEMKMYCNYFNEIGKRCQQNGMKFGYHNHAHEFQKVENQAVMLDYMIENTNPEYVFFQMDVYWIVRGQHSPVDYFNKYPGRFTVLHIKDDKEIGDSGMVGFDAIFRNAKVAGVKHIVAEIEGYSCPVEESVKKSLDYLLDAPFVKASYSK